MGRDCWLVLLRSWREKAASDVNVHETGQKKRLNKRDVNSGS